MPSKSRLNLLRPNVTCFLSYKRDKLPPKLPKCDFPWQTKRDMQSKLAKSRLALLNVTMQATKRDMQSKLAKSRLAPKRDPPYTKHDSPKIQRQVTFGASMPNVIH
ncbi:hypothetical protein PIB30_114896, partial [Stylosanthes scabra]|nr:hypothetical protein [Stylosanthes scabra]